MNAQATFRTYVLPDRLGVSEYLSQFTSSVQVYDISLLNDTPYRSLSLTLFLESSSWRVGLLTMHQLQLPIPRGDHIYILY